MPKRQPFYFLRHGQTDWNKDGIIQGQTDVPLNAFGRSQAEQAKLHLSGIPVMTICSSPLSRALQTAEIVQKTLNCRLISIDKLKECHFGEAEGKQITGETYDEIIRSAGSYGGENFEVFAGRVMAGINEALSYPGPVLIISHGGVFHAMQSRTRFEYHGDMPNCAPVYLKPATGDEQNWAIEPVKSKPDS